MRIFTKDGGTKCIEDGSDCIPLLIKFGWIETIETPKIKGGSNGNKTITPTE